MSHGFDKNVNRYCYYCRKDDFEALKLERLHAFEMQWVALLCFFFAVVFFSPMTLCLHTARCTQEKERGKKDVIIQL